jgi:hypothetical protein
MSKFIFDNQILEPYGVYFYEMDHFKKKKKRNLTTLVLYNRSIEPPKNCTAKGPKVTFVEVFMVNKA